MDVVVAQLLTMISMFVAMVLSCLLPFILGKIYAGSKRSNFEGGRYELCISLANCFSGGVFVATFFVGLLPHVKDEFKDILSDGNFQTNFPVTEFVVFMGFFLALFVEHLSLIYQQRKKSKAATTDNVMVTISDATNNEVANGCDHSSPNKEAATEEEQLKMVPEVGHHGHSHDITGIISKGGQQDSGVRFYMLVLSLSVHSVFEGMALGLQSHLSDLLNLFVGVIIHECLVAFAMGVSLSRIKPKISLIFKFAVLFSIMIPVGQALGLLVGNQNSFVGKVSGAILQGIAAGTFIHVTFLEVIPTELYDKRYILLKIFFILLGFLLITGCIFALDHHNHDHVINNHDDDHHHFGNSSQHPDHH